MRKWMLAITAIVVGVWLLMWAGSAVMEKAMARQVDREWPLGLGTIAGVPERYPRAAPTVAAQRLIALTQPLEESPSAIRDEIRDYGIRQIQRANATIDAPPSSVDAFLREHSAELDSIRALLISGSPIGWEQNIELGPMAPVPKLGGQMALSRVLAASALSRARRGEAAAWDDLRAVWMLHRNLLERPEIVSVLIGVAGARLVNAAARKMRLPAPEWLGDLQRYDYRRAMVAAYQADAWTISQMVSIEMMTDTAPDDPAAAALGRARDTLLAPYMRLCTSDEADRWRRTAVDLAASNVCEIQLSSRETVPWWNLPARAMTNPNLASIWARVFRFRAEIEATERALDLRQGRPPKPRSACSDGTWVYSAGGFRFSRRFPPPEVSSAAIPVEFWLTR